MKQVGKILLLVSGIALLAVGVWSLIQALLGLLAVIGGAAVSGSGEGGAIAGIIVMVYGILLFIVSVVSLLFNVFAGVRGIKTFAKGDEKNVRKAFVWSIVILVLSVIGIVAGSLANSSITSTIVTLVIDAAYITGAFMVKLSK